MSEARKAQKNSNQQPKDLIQSEGSAHEWRWIRVAKRGGHLLSIRWNAHRPRVPSSLSLSSFFFLSFTGAETTRHKLRRYRVILAL
jgi:hypothetical protein